MMSYLWILLLGSLLAAGGKAQEDEVPTEEAGADPTPEPDVEADASQEAGADDEAPGSEEVIEPTEETESGPEAPTEEEVEDDHHDHHPDGDAEATIAPDDEEVPTTEAGDTEVGDPADGDSATEAPVAEVEDSVTTEAAEEEAEPTPAPADPDVQEPEAEAEAEEPTDKAEEEITEAAPAVDEAPEEKTEADDKPAPATEEAAADDEEPTVPAAGPEPMNTDIVEEKEIVPDVKAEVESKVPDDSDVATEKPTKILDADGGLNLEDALADPAPANNPPSSRSGVHVAEATGEVDKPEAQEASSGSIAGILSAIGGSIVAAVAGYFTYQKRKLCFKNRPEADPEAARKADAAEAQSEPQVLSNLLNSS